MAITMSFALVVIISIYNLLNNRKYEDFTDICIIVFMTIIMGANTLNPDLNNGIHDVYTRIYNQGTIFEKDIGYGFLMQFFKLLGLNYVAFRMVSTILSLFAIQHTLRKYIKNRSVFFYIYMFYPFLMDVVQIRNFLLMTVLFFVLPYFLEDTKKATIISIIGVLIGASLQKTGLLYLPLCFLKYIIKKDKIRIFRVVGITGVIIAFSTPVIVRVMNHLSGVSFLSRIPGLTKYFSKFDTGRGYLVHYFAQILLFAVTWVAYHFFLNTNTISEDNKKIISFTYYANLYLLLFLGLGHIDITFTRIPRNMILYIIIVFCTVISTMKGKNRYKYKLNYRYIIMCIVTIAAFAFNFWRYLYSTNYESIILTVLNNNWIF